MMRHIVIAGVIISIAAHASAQNADELLREAQNAFQSLDFPGAARWYNLVLGAGSGATPAQQDTARLYAGVSYDYAGERENALTAFRALVRASPCMPVPRAFGASVTRVFTEAIESVMAIGLCNFEEQSYGAIDSVSLDIVVTRAARVLVMLKDSVGGTLAQMVAEVPEGAQVLDWPSPVNPASISNRPGQFSLVLRAQDTGGTATGDDSIAVQIHASTIDTIPHPAPLNDSQLLPEMRSVSSGVGDLGKGLLVGAGIAATSLLTYSSLSGEAAKAVAVGGAVSLAGIVAMVRGGSDRIIVENQQYNETLRSAWRAQRDSVITLNQAAIADREVVISPVRGGR